jgi:Ca2+-binding RTX toxin-like protein
VRFSEALASSSNLTNVYLKNALDTVIATTTQIDQSGELVIMPTVSLANGTAYALTWDANTLFDLAGNSASALDRAAALSFTTVVGSIDVIDDGGEFDTIVPPIPLPELTDVDLVPTVQFRSFINGVETLIQPTFFAGPSSLNLDYQVIDTTPNAVIVGSTLNDFIVLQGGGNKAVDGGLGDDVIDGGTGSTFMSGGGGSNTFFLDGRASGVSWSTITDFQLGGGDKATIWGWTEGVSLVKEVVENGGATGYTGLTLHFEHLLPDGSASTARNSSLNSITFTSKSLSDFGAKSVAELNQQIASGSNSHFIVGATNDMYGEHGYLFIS